MNYTFVTCINSKVENPTKFYGQFEIGPFAPGQGLTVANALRRSLLSQLSGSAITLVEIQGASHEYEILTGVRESILDIILNLKEIILTSDFEIFSPQIGFLNVKGPGKVCASDLKLPSFLYVIDPNQYIATLTTGGTLNMKFLVSYGKNYITHNPGNVHYLQSLSILTKTKPFLNNFSKKSEFYFNYKSVKFFNFTEPLLFPQTFTRDQKPKNSPLLKQKKVFSLFLPLFLYQKLFNNGNLFSNSLFLNQTPRTVLKSKIKKQKCLVKNRVFILNFYQYWLKEREFFKQDSAFGSKTNDEKKKKKIQTFALDFPRVSTQGQSLRDSSLVNSLFEKKIGLTLIKQLRFNTSNILSFYKTTLNFLNYSRMAKSQEKSKFKKKAFSNFSFFPFLLTQNQKGKTNKIQTHLAKNLNRLTNSSAQNNKENSPQFKVFKLDSSFPETKSPKIGYFPIDAVFMPINRVNYTIEAADDLKIVKDRVILEVWTNGSVNPRDAIHKATTSLIQLLLPLQQKKKNCLFVPFALKKKKVKIKSMHLKEPNLFLLSQINPKSKINKQKNVNSHKSSFRSQLLFESLSVFITKIDSLVKLHKETAFSVFLGKQTRQKQTFSYRLRAKAKKLNKFKLENHWANKKKRFNSSSEKRRFTSLKNIDSRILELDIANLQLAAKDFSFLKQIKIDTISALVSTPKTELLSIIGFNTNLLKNIEKALSQKGLFLKE